MFREYKGFISGHNRKSIACLQCVYNDLSKGWIKCSLDFLIAKYLLLGFILTQSFLLHTGTGIKLYYNIKPFW